MILTFCPIYEVKKKMTSLWSQFTKLTRWGSDPPRSRRLSNRQKNVSKPGSSLAEGLAFGLFTQPLEINIATIWGFPVHTKDSSKCELGSWVCGQQWPSNPSCPNRGGQVQSRARLGAGCGTGGVPWWRTRPRQRRDAKWSYCPAQVKHTAQRMAHYNSHTGLLLWQASRALLVHSLSRLICDTSYRQSSIRGHEEATLTWRNFSQNNPGIHHSPNTNITWLIQLKIVSPALLDLTLERIWLRYGM